MKSIMKISELRIMGGWRLQLLSLTLSVLPLGAYSQEGIVGVLADENTWNTLETVGNIHEAWNTIDDILSFIDGQADIASAGYSSVVSGGSGSLKIGIRHEDMIFRMLLFEQLSAKSLPEEVKLLHPKYSRNYSSKPITPLRGLDEVLLKEQVTYADSIDSVMLYRRKVELMNLAERQIDLQYLVEKARLDEVMGIFSANIGQITFCGGTHEEEEFWQEIYQMEEETIEATHDAYMSGGCRAEVYESVYKDVLQRNYELWEWLKFKSNVKKMKDFYEERGKRRQKERDSIRSVCDAARGRWLENLRSTRDAHYSVNEKWRWSPYMTSNSH